MKVVPVTMHAVERVRRLLHSPTHTDAAATTAVATAAAPRLATGATPPATPAPAAAPISAAADAAEAALTQLLANGDVILLNGGSEPSPLPRARTSKGKKAGAPPPDHTVHPERFTPAGSKAGSGGGVGEGGAALPPFTFIELFAGIGGFRAGLTPIGGRCVFTSEIDAWAAAVYAANYGDSNGADAGAGGSGEGGGEICDGTTPTPAPTSPGGGGGGGGGPGAAAAAAAGAGARSQSGPAEAADGGRGPEPQPATVVAGDILAVDPASIPDHDILTGGFPCQPFSTLGDQPGIGAADGKLFRAIVAVLKAKQPAGFLLENVPGLLTCDDGKAFVTIKAALEDVGYAVSHELLNARCLCAQARNRVYLAGRLLPKGTNRGGDASSTATAAAAAAAASTDASTDAMANASATECLLPPFEFPFVPDLRLRLRDVLEPEAALAATGHHAAKYTLNVHQWQRLQSTVAWRRRGPSDLAWPDTIARAVISHYGTDLGGGASQLVPRPSPHNPRCFTPREALRLQGFDGTAFTLSTRNTNVADAVAVACGGSAAAGVGAGTSGAGTDANTAQRISAALEKEPKSYAAAGRLYKMIGNAVVPPVICILGASLLAQLPRSLPAITQSTMRTGSESVQGEPTLPTAAMQVAWRKAGLAAAVQLAIKAVRPEERARVLQQPVVLPDGTAPALAALLC